MITKSLDVAVPAFSVTAADTTGAGDAFIGAFAAKLIQDGGGYGELDADAAKSLLRHANACGAIIASRFGAIEAMPTLFEVETFIKAYG